MLLELKEYATEVDVDFVRRAVRAIGRCAIKLDKATERCINTLLDLIKTKVIADKPRVFEASVFCILNNTLLVCTRCPM